MNFTLYSCFICILYSFQLAAADFGFKPGFLTHKESLPKKDLIVKVLGNKPVNNQSSSYSNDKQNDMSLIVYDSTHKALELFNRINDHDVENASLVDLWENETLINKEAREQLYKVLKFDIVGLQGLEAYFTNLIDIKDFKKACNNEDQFNNFLKFWSMASNVLAKYNSKPELGFHSQVSYKFGHVDELPYEKDKYKAIFESFVLQNIAHHIVQTLFNYMNNLAEAEAVEFKRKFITQESNEEQGEFVLLKREKYFADTVFLPKGTTIKFHYFQQRLHNGKKVYRIYDEHASDYAFKYLTQSSSLKGYSRGEIKYFSKKAVGDLLNESGFLIDKNDKFINKKGFVLVKQYLFDTSYSVEKNKNNIIFLYDKHPILDQMFFFQQGRCSIKETDNPLFDQLLDAIGGIEVLDKEELIFIPDLNKTILPVHAKLLLPYFLGLQQAIEQGHVDYETDQVSALKATISELEEVLVKDELSLHGENFTKQAQQEIIEPLVESAKSTIYNNMLEEKPITAVGKERKKQQKNYKNYAKKQAKQDLNSKIDPNTLEKIRKEKALNKIRNQYMKKIGGNCFSTKEVLVLLSDFKDDLKSLDIHSSGNRTQRGSHIAHEIMGPGGVEQLSYVNRPEKDGFRSGTLKTIVEGWITKALSISIKKPSNN